MNKAGMGALLTIAWLMLLTRQTTAQVSQRYAYIARTTLCRVWLDLPGGQEAEINEVLLTTKQQGVNVRGIGRNQIPQEHNNCESRAPRPHDLHGRLQLTEETLINISNGGELWLSCTTSSSPININQFYEEYIQDDPLDEQMQVATWISRVCKPGR